MFSHYNEDITGTLRLAYAALDAPWREALTHIVGARACACLVDHLEASCNAVKRPAMSEASLDQAFGASHRRAFGLYYTPSVWARFLASSAGFHARAERATSAEPLTALDLSAGDGALLVAMLERYGDRVAVYAVEREPASAMLAAMRIALARQRLGAPPLSVRDRVLVGGDGLAVDVLERLGLDEVDVVLGNPPYKGEKGSKAFFDELFATHPHLAPRRTKRLDLLYLFMLQGLDALAPGGIMAHLTSAYWLQAQGALMLRRELGERADAILFWRRDGAPLFQDAPGHHSLVSVYSARDERTPWSPRAYVAKGDESTAATLRDIYTRATPSCGVDANDAGGDLRPFVPHRVHAQASAFRRMCLRLGDHFDIRQGFVSGADRVTSRHLPLLEESTTLKRGDPIFLFGGHDKVPDALLTLLGRWLFPVVRGSHIHASEIISAPKEGALYGLYIDQEIDASLEPAAWFALSEHLSPARAILERRREVAQGKIPWYRLHWPRSREEQLGDKLVLARRGACWRVALDLGQHVVSSDCTYIARALSPDRTARRELFRVMLTLALPELERDLRVYGKQKGALFEFYGEPLASLPLPLMPGDHGELCFDPRALGSARAGRLEEEVERATCALS